MKNQNSKTTSLWSRKEKVLIQNIADKMSEQISQVVAASWIELFSELKENNIQTEIPLNYDEFLKAADVAEILKISKAQAYQLIKTREVASFSIGKIVRVRRVDLDAFIQSHTVR